MNHSSLSHEPIVKELKPKKKPFITKNHLVLMALGLFIIGISVFFAYVHPEEIIERIGVTNGYLVIAFFALFGGFSAFTSVSFYTTVISFTIGGLNPFYVALVAMPGLFIGDTVFYIFGNAINGVLSKRMKKYVKKINEFMNRPKIYKISPLLIFAYVGLSPLPPDVLIVALSVSKYPYKRMILPLLLGEINFVFMVSFFAKRGIELFGF
jgi:membrane protein YqaA with SNARE-associated domain